LPTVTFTDLGAQEMTSMTKVSAGEALFLDTFCLDAIAHLDLAIREGKRRAQPKRPPRSIVTRPAKQLAP